MQYIFLLLCSKHSHGSPDQRHYSLVLVPTCPEHVQHMRYRIFNGCWLLSDDSRASWNPTWHQKCLIMVMSDSVFSHGSLSHTSVAHVKSGEWIGTLTVGWSDGQETVPFSLNTIVWTWSVVHFLLFQHVLLFLFLTCVKKVKLQSPLPHSGVFVLF